MIDRTYAFFEQRILAWETLRRGRRLAARVGGGAEAIGSLAEIPARLGDAKIVSFDLFDTLLHRRALGAEETARKTAGFARLIAGPEAGQAVWAARHDLAPRLKAEMIAAGEGDEPPLALVFRTALKLAGVKRARPLADRLAAFETASEALNVVAAPGAAALLADLRAEGLTVIAVSDMYLPGASIRVVLERAGLGAAFDHVFVSCEHKATKRGGALFSVVAGALNAAPADMLHIGDRLDGDAAPARAAGWRALHYVNRAEIAGAEARRIAESYTPSPALRRRQTGGALNMAEERGFRSAEDIVEQLVGPACGALVLAAFGRASRIGAARLHHLSRDGAVLGEIAGQVRRLHPHLAPAPLEIRELAVSRAQGALLSLRTSEDLPKLAHLALYLTGAPASAASLQAAFGLPAEVFRRELRSATGAAFMALLAHPRHARPVAAALDERREAVEAYLASSGVLDAVPAVAMDIGYSGTFAAQLSHLLHARPAPGRRIEFLFLATSRYLNGNLKRLHPQIALHPGVALDHRRRSARAATRNFAWIEPFLTDPDRGRLTGYAGGAPVFAESPLAPQAAARARVIRAAIRARALRFADEFHASPGGLGEVAALLHRRMARLSARPTRREAASVRSLAHLVGNAANGAKDPTRAVNPLRLFGEMEALRTGDFWVQGSLARSGLGLVNALTADRPEAGGRADPRFGEDWP